MRYLTFLVVLLTLSGCSNQPVANHFSLDLDVPEESYSAWNYNDIGGQATLEIEAKFIERRKTPNWNPSASFQIISSDGNGHAALVITNREDDKYQVFLSSRTKNPVTGEISTSEPVYFSREIAFNSDFKITINFVTPGFLQATLDGNETMSIKVDYKVANLRVSNSSGEIDITKMAIVK